ncbi:MAG: LCP family protein, partial [Solirubrobacterales bacterium]
ATGARRVPWLRMLKWLVVSAVLWAVFSGVLFVISATIESNKVSDATNARLGGGGNFVTGPGTVLVLGLDKRPPGSKEPGASTTTARSDSMMLLRTGGGVSRRLSILRDTYAEIPGYQAQKINAAYALGGTALTVQTVENFLGNGLEINHVVIVDFERFPQLIDALGGINVKVRERCIRSTFGGKTFRLRRGEHHLSGEQALRYARVRKNACDPGEDDRDRARRQQTVMSSMKSKAFSPFTFIRLPWVAWAAPKAIVTDMSPFTLMGFLTGVTTGPDPRTDVLKPTGIGPGSSLIVPDTERTQAARRLLRD